MGTRACRGGIGCLMCGSDVYDVDDSDDEPFVAFAFVLPGAYHTFVFPSALGLCLSERSPVAPVCWRVTSQRSSDTFHLPTTSITNQPQFFDKHNTTGVLCRMIT